MSRSETEYLRHIQEEARYLTEAGRECSWEEFSDNETLKRASVRSIEVIGEAMKNLSTDIRIGTRRSTGERWLGCVTS